MRKGAGTDGTPFSPREKVSGEARRMRVSAVGLGSLFNTRRERPRREQLIVLRAELSSGPAGPLLPGGEGVRVLCPRRRNAMCAVTSVT